MSLVQHMHRENSEVAGDENTSDTEMVVLVEAKTQTPSKKGENSKRRKKRVSFSVGGEDGKHSDTDDDDSLNRVSEIIISLEDDNEVDVQDTTPKKSAKRYHAILRLPEDEDAEKFANLKYLKKLELPLPKCYECSKSYNGSWDDLKAECLKSDKNAAFLFPGPGDYEYKFHCKNCNGGVSKLTHSQKVWKTITSTVLYNLIKESNFTEGFPTGNLAETAFKHRELLNIDASKYSRNAIIHRMGDAMCRGKLYCKYKAECLFNSEGLVEMFSSSNAVYDNNHNTSNNNNNSSNNNNKNDDSPNRHKSGKRKTPTSTPTSEKKRKSDSSDANDNNNNANTPNDEQKSKKQKAEKATDSRKDLQVREEVVNNSSSSDNNDTNNNSNNNNKNSNDSSSNSNTPSKKQSKNKAGDVVDNSKNQDSNGSTKKQEKVGKVTKILASPTGTKQLVVSESYNASSPGVGKDVVFLMWEDETKYSGFVRISLKSTIEELRKTIKDYEILLLSSKDLFLLWKAPVKPKQEAEVLVEECVTACPDDASKFQIVIRRHIFGSDK